VTDKRPEPRAKQGAAESDAPITDRPPFDPVQFARESEARLRATDAPTSGMPTVRPPPGAGLDAEALLSLQEVRAPAGSIPDVQVDSDSGADEALGIDAIPFVAVSRDDLPWFDLAVGAVKLLAHIDGVRTLEVVFARADIPEDEGVSLLLAMAEQGIVSFR
jgi:hypothetical protein